jgi:hypothetical protein
MSPDPLYEMGRLEDASTWKLYTYALADPANRNDPSGF